MIIGTTKIEKHFNENNKLFYVSFVDLEESDCEYREYSDGTKIWCKDGLEHRDGDEPAVILVDGTKEWYKNGKHHRDGDKPAIIYPDGTKLWYKNGQRHRDGDEPAVILVGRRKAWYKNGEFIKSSNN